MTTIDTNLVRAVIFSIPLVCALVCMALILLDVKRSTNRVYRKMHCRMGATYGSFSLAWAWLVLHAVAPAAFLYTFPFFPPIVMISHVICYMMVRKSTDWGRGLVLSWEYFATPAVMFAALLAIWLTVPIDTIAGVIFAPGTNPVRCAILLLVLTYNIGFQIMALVEIRRYRRIVARNSGDPIHSGSLDRLFGAILAEIVVLPVPVCGMLIGVAPFAGMGLMWIVSVMPSFTIYIVSCSNLLSDNYIAIDTDELKKTSGDDAAFRLSRERIERYLDTKKPYLNSEFLITDMAEDLFSNRSYVSNFINREYGMNFNRFINGYRLREMERLRQEAARKRQSVPLLQLVMNSGFGNYRSYLRARSLERTDPPVSPVRRKG